MEPRRQPSEPNPATPMVPQAGPERREPPHPPPAGPAPGPPGTSRGGGRRWSRLRVVLVVLAGVLALLCVGGVGVGYVLYDQATRPDRSAPDVVVDNYLRALLVDRNDTQVTLYACSDKAGLDEIRAFAADIQAREKEHSIDIAVSWGSLDVQLDGRQASVTTEISRTIRDGSERDLSTWRFVVVEDDGWRVCQARRI